MKLTVKSASSLNPNTPFLILPLAAASSTKKRDSINFSKPFQEELSKLDRLYGGEIKKKLTQFDFKATVGRHLSVSVSGTDGRSTQTVRCASLGEDPFSSEAEDRWRKIGGDAFQKAREGKSKSLTIHLAAIPKKELERVLELILEGVHLATYTFKRYLKTKSKEKNRKENNTPQEIIFSGISLKQPTLRALANRAENLSQAVNFARDLVNLPPCDLRPLDIVKYAKKIQSSSKGKLRLTVYNRAALKRLGAGALLAVAQGSSAEPFMLHLVYKPKKHRKGQKKIALIGKGITFDSGGLSIKPAGGMETMKCDMAGAACVLGVMKAISNLQGEDALQDEIHAIIPTAENMINGEATRPGDIVFAMNGKSIEILNTDAEGRLILADALSYSKRINADITIDLATLTGACVVALGNSYAGLFTKSEKLEKEIRRFGKAAGELYWPLPLADEYRSLMDSRVANLKNIGPGGPGATIGALFLQEFVPEKTTWAHIDIAGPAFVDKATEYSVPGGTGFGVRTLTAYLQNL